MGFFVFVFYFYHYISFFCSKSQLEILITEHFLTDFTFLHCFIQQRIIKLPDAHNKHKNQSSLVPTCRKKKG